jgi:hypothetical protein
VQSLFIIAFSLDSGILGVGWIYLFSGSIWLSENTRSPMSTIYTVAGMTYPERNHKILFIKGFFLSVQILLRIKCRCVV